MQREEGVDKVVAVDSVAPAHQLGDAEFVQADIGRRPSGGCSRSTASTPWCILMCPGRRSAVVGGPP
ncbi:hypothetical protein ACFQVA_16730 [Actinomadura keratinilytica]